MYIKKSFAAKQSIPKFFRVFLLAMKSVYLDNAATTRVRDEVVQRMELSLKEWYGNPSSTHSFGRTAKAQVEKARKTIAGYLKALPSEIIFTSGGTEADNMILRGAVRDLEVRTIITSPIEHHAVLHTVEQLEREYAITVKYLRLDAWGNPDFTHLETLLQEPGEKKLVSLMHVNNEIGNILSIDEVAELCKKYGAWLHSDAVQSIGHLEWNVQKTGVDFLAASAHKFHGPKGVGFAYIRKNSNLKPLIFGGEQERGHRAGTEAIHNIVGLEEALTQAYNRLAEEQSYIFGLKSYFIEKIQTAFPTAFFNGMCADNQKSAYNLVNVCLPFEEELAPLLLFHLDMNGIACSKGSACQSGSDTGSHVLRNILDGENLKKPSLRFSFSIYNTREEIDYTIAVLKKVMNGEV